MKLPLRQFGGVSYGPKNSYPCSCSGSFVVVRRGRGSGERLGSGLDEVDGAFVFFTLAARVRLGGMVVAVAVAELMRLQRCVFERGKQWRGWQK